MIASGQVDFGHLGKALLVFFRYVKLSICMHIMHKTACSVCFGL